MSNDMPALTPTVTIAMVGPTRVGKTSLVAAMYGELEKELVSIGCTFSMEGGPTTRSINERLRELKRLGSEDSCSLVQEGEGIDPGVEKKEYVFHLDVGDGGSPEAIIKFVDLPGGWYMANENSEEADKILRDANVSFLAVDAVALMEQPSAESDGLGKYHERVNAPDYIKEAYKRALPHLDESHIIILTLIRAETYVRKNRTDELMEKAKDAYREMTSYLKKNGVQIKVYACYVETVGSVVFHAFDESDGSVHFHYRRVPGKKYSPSRCAIPLRIAARTALSKALDHAFEEFVKNDTLWARVSLLCGGGHALTQAKQKATRIYEAFQKVAENVNDEDYHQIHT